MAVNSEARLPVDETVKLPPSVVAAAAAADAAHKAAYQTPDKPAEAQTPVPAPAPEPPKPVPPPAPEAIQPAPAKTPEEVNWEHRYLSMKGRHDQAQQTIGSLQQTLTDMGDELTRTQSLIRTPADQRDKQPGQAPQFLTQDDMEKFGPELIDFVQRAAQQAVAPELNQTIQQVRQVSQRVTQTGQRAMLESLAEAVPNWQEINSDPRFKAWCNLPDIYSGAVRGKLLNAAYQAASAPRVIAFFKGFLAEEQATGQISVPQTQPQAFAPAPRVPAVNIETLTAPGAAKPATGNSSGVAADKPVFTRAQVASFYSAVRQGQYVGREQEKQTNEEMLFAAMREGRVR